MNPQNQDPFSIDALNRELSAAITNLGSYHAKMETMGEYYSKSAFYQRRAGESINNTLADNYLKIFADKNIQYTSEMPAFKIAGTPDDRENANIREKILYAVHRQSGTPLLQKRWARDAVKRSIAIAETSFDLKKRCAVIKRYDPRYVYWKMSNANEDRVEAFWAVFPISLEEAQRTYGVTPTADPVSKGLGSITDPYILNMNGDKWFTMAIRWDQNTRVSWIGNQMIEQPHEHMMGAIPIDICAPFPTDDRHQLGHFYLEDLVPMQAELNDTVMRRSKIVKRMSNPIAWGRNIKTRGFDEVKAAFENGDSGILGLGKDGEVGILQLNEVRMLDNQEASLKSDMQRLSGFAAASFGESVGANTSGDALGMYFTPTQKHIDDQNISWVAFYESINAKILRMYDIFGRDGSEFSITGYSPRSTLLATTDSETNETTYSMAGAGDYHDRFTNQAIKGNYTNRAIPPPVIPRNELAEKQFWTASAKDKIVSRTTAYEKIGLESPEDEKQLLMLEQSEPLLNPDGTASILQGIQGMMPQGLPAGAPPTSNPALPPPPVLQPASR